MALDNFTITHSPYNGELLDDSNTLYIDSDRGNDAFTGSREFPKKTLGSVSSIFGANVTKNILLRGRFDGITTYTVSNSNNLIFIGEPNTYIESLLFTGTGAMTLNIYFYNSRIFKVEGTVIGSSTYVNIFFQNCEVIDLVAAPHYYYTVRARDSIFRAAKFHVFDGVKTTVGRFSHMPKYAGQYIFREIIITAFMDIAPELPNTITVDVVFSLENCILLKKVVWMYGGTPIPIPWGSTGSLIDDVKAGINTYATTVLPAGNNRNFLLNNINTIFGQGTIIYDDENPANTRIFNAYGENGEVADFSLNFDQANPALYHGINMNRIGGMLPKFNIQFGNIDVIDNDGVVTSANTGDLLVKDPDGRIRINPLSGQNRNKTETGVITMPAGEVFSRFQANFFPSNSLGLYIGPLQNLTGGLSPINAVVIQPYDTLSQPSTLPKFCAPTDRETQIAYFLSGPKEGEPVTFNDLDNTSLFSTAIPCNKNLAECGTWAVTNAVDEWDSVRIQPNVRVSVPFVRYFKLIIIANNII